MLSTSPPWPNYIWPLAQVSCDQSEASIQVTCIDQSESWFLTNYSLSLGSLGLALVVWQNSLVLHNISKVVLSWIIILEVLVKLE